MKVTKKEWKYFIGYIMITMIATHLAVYALTKYGDQKEPPFVFYIFLIFAGWSIVLYFKKPTKSMMLKINKLMK